MPPRRESHVPGSWYAAAREHAGLTQQEVAERLGLTQGQVSRRERGRSPVPQEGWIALLAVLGLPQGWRPPRSRR